MATNDKHYCFIPNRTEESASGTKQKAAVLNGVRWDAGATVTVRFMEGDQDLRARVKAVASEWMEHANVKLSFVNEGEADIRIAFKQGNGSWSYLGTDATSIPADQPTMNYGWLTPDSPEDDVRRVVLHEFGHALGLIHDHQNPNGGIRWNRDAVIKDLSGPPNNWDPETIENNIFKTYDAKAVTASDADRTSIMMYPIPQAWTLDEFSAELNNELSVLDKEIIGKAYPR
ncbi:M12 family metallopeptidase [Pseudoduganella sp. SL102]|uniref:matrixin family metalloprotease n=1 Tax=Pseudoduganella sp. SL102 TaxID=2995154 RepID=UPI00248D08EF|nr:matrixin family metalloprotease [Pseudoduganella sp. SL102]WBS00122.1 M12 family metallopeptidase [Pseudoduganella sp. SL102]